MNELTHVFNFKRSVLCNQISPKHVHDTSVSRSIFFATNAQIVLKFSPYLARGSPIIFHTKILPIGSIYLQKADIRSPKQNCTPDGRPFHLEAACSLLPSCFAVKRYYAKGLINLYYTGLALWKHHVNLLLQSFRSVSSDFHQC